MNRRTLFLAIALVLFAFSGATLSLNKPRIDAGFAKVKDFFTNSHSTRNRVELLFLQQADSGSIVVDNDKPGCYTLTLANLHQHVLYFSDQPKRKAGRLTLKEFLETWSHDRIKPNVAMQAFAVNREDVKEINMVAVLSNPKYNAKNQSMTYTACPISSSKIMANLNLRSVNLFIDPIQQWPP